MYCLRLQDPVHIKDAENFRRYIQFQQNKNYHYYFFSFGDFKKLLPRGLWRLSTVDSGSGSGDSGTSDLPEDAGPVLDVD